MGIIFPLLAMLAGSFSTAIDRLNFKRTRIAPQQLMPLMFAACAIILLLFILLTRQPFPHFTLISLGLMTLIGVVSFGANVFDYLSLKVDDLALREPLNDFEPIAAGLIAYALFPSERKPGFLIVFIVSVGIVYWGTHRHKLRKLQSKGMFHMLLSISLYALLPSIYKVTLHYLTPAYVSLFRVTTIVLLSAVTFPRLFPKQKLPRLTSMKLTYALLSGIACSVVAIANLYAISSLGVVLTMMIMLVGPFLRYTAGYYILKEKARKAEMVSSFLLAGVAVVTLVKY